MAWSLIEAVGLLGVALFLLRYYFSLKFEFWKKRGVNGPKPLPFVGNFSGVYLGKSSVSECFERAYYEFKDEPVVGVYAGSTPLLVLRDPEFMKDVLIKDFSKFVERTIQPNRKMEPLSQHLFRLEAEKWRPLRTKLSPVFTSGKLKEMFHLIAQCADHFEEYLMKLSEKGEPLECRDLSAKFTTDVIGVCAFGIEINALASDDCEFRKMGKKIFQSSWKTWFRDRIRNVPILFDILGPLLLDYDIVTFFKNLTTEAVDYRIQNNFHRHDFIDALVDLKQHPEKLGIKELDDMFMTAQAFVFFVAGFETSSITITNALYELALNPSVQEKARREIKAALEKTDGRITYDGIREMKYLNACFQETLRKYPVVLWLSRKAMSDYTFSGTKITIPKDQQVFFPVFAVQRDPEIYPDPEKFDPERFNEENVKNRHPMFFLPFGDGPRNCIGARFAVNQTKVALIKVLSNFKLETCEKTVKEYPLDKKSLFLLQPTKGIYLKMTKLVS